MSYLQQLEPLDESNQTLQANVHPLQWTNPTPSGRYNLVVIGAGTAGLVTAAGAAGLGAKVALIERGLMGGDCLNVGCVPSKALISAGRVAASARHSAEFGVRGTDAINVDFAAVMERMRRLRAQISPNDSAERFRKLGIDVFFGQASFVDSSTVDVNGTRLKFKRAVIASGARAAAPPISGLDTVEYLWLSKTTPMFKRFTRWTEPSWRVKKTALSRFTLRREPTRSSAQRSSRAQRVI